MDKNVPEQIFYHESLQSYATLILGEEEFAHARSLRIREGERIFLTDGKGNFAFGRVVLLNSKRLEVRTEAIDSQTFRENAYIHIALAPTKNQDRIEWFVEKAVEIGIDEISFLITDFSEKKNLVMERLQKKAIAAMKQSKRFFLPKINPILPFKQFIENIPVSQKAFLAHLIEDASQTLFKIAPPKARYCVLIGAEGGFSEKEILLATQHQIPLVRLGKSRLRTETAALAACLTLNLINE